LACRFAPEGAVGNPQTPKTLRWPGFAEARRALIQIEKTMSSRPNNNRSNGGAQRNNRPRFQPRQNKPRQDAATQNPGQWQQRYDHHMQLAEHASGDDPVARELHWQNAEHFRRLLNGSSI
jgi:hypothetical protein